MTDIEVKLKELSKKTGKRVTLTSLVSWALAKYVCAALYPARMRTQANNPN